MICYVPGMKYSKRTSKSRQLGVVVARSGTNYPTIFWVFLVCERLVCTDIYTACAFLRESTLAQRGKERDERFYCQGPLWFLFPHVFSTYFEGGKRRLEL